ncbi:MAG: heme exporter protein CcmD [Rhodospirillaceae bacterium]|nr:heme exporter protein CcmD [Rhodospirillaceae bacterium]
MEQFQTFIDMGGYAFFVWSAYALATAGLVGVWYMYRRTMKIRQAELDQLRPPREPDAPQE